MSRWCSSYEATCSDGSSSADEAESLLQEEVPVRQGRLLAIRGLSAAAVVLVVVLVIVLIRSRWTRSTHRVTSEVVAVTRSTDLLSLRASAAHCRSEGRSACVLQEGCGWCNRSSSCHDTAFAAGSLGCDAKLERFCWERYCARLLQTPPLLA